MKSRAAGPFTETCRSLSFSTATLGAHQHVDHSVEIVEEGEEVECKFAPAFFLTVGQDVSVHDGGGVIETRTAHHRTTRISPDVVGQQGQIEAEGEPLGRTEKHHTEEEVDQVLRQHQWI